MLSEQAQANPEELSRLCRALHNLRRYVGECCLENVSAKIWLTAFLLIRAYSRIYWDIFHVLKFDAFYQRGI